MKRRRYPDIDFAKANEAVPDERARVAFPPRGFPRRHILEHRRRVARVDVEVVKPLTLTDVVLGAAALVTLADEGVRVDGPFDRTLQEPAPENLHARGGRCDTHLTEQDVLDVVVEFLQHSVKLDAVRRVVREPRLPIGFWRVQAERAQRFLVLARQPETLGRLVQARRDELQTVDETPASVAKTPPPHVHDLDARGHGDHRKLKPQRAAHQHQPGQEEQVVEAPGVVRVDVLAAVLLLQHEPHPPVHAAAFSKVMLLPVLTRRRRLVEKSVVPNAVVHAEHEGPRKAGAVRKVPLALQVQHDEVAPARLARERCELGEIGAHSTEPQRYSSLPPPKT